MRYCMRIVQLHEGESENDGRLYRTGKHKGRVRARVRKMRQVVHQTQEASKQETRERERERGRRTQVKEESESQGQMGETRRTKTLPEWDSLAPTCRH